MLVKEKLIIDALKEYQKTNPTALYAEVLDYMMVLADEQGFSDEQIATMVMNEQGVGAWLKKLAGAGLQAIAKGLAKFAPLAQKAGDALARDTKAQLKGSLDAMAKYKDEAPQLYKLFNTTTLEFGKEWVNAQANLMKVLGTLPFDDEAAHKKILDTVTKSLNLANKQLNETWVTIWKDLVDKEIERLKAKKGEAGAEGEKAPGEATPAEKPTQTAAGAPAAPAGEKLAAGKVLAAHPTKEEKPKPAEKTKKEVASITDMKGDEKQKVIMECSCDDVPEPTDFDKRMGGINI